MTGPVALGLARQADELDGHGLEIVEWLMAEYQVPLVDAVWTFPLAAAVALLPLRNQRTTGNSAGPATPQQAAIAARNRARVWLQQEFQIVDASPEAVGWKLGSRIAPHLVPD